MKARVQSPPDQGLTRVQADEGQGRWSQPLRRPGQGRVQSRGRLTRPDSTFKQIPPQASPLSPHSGLWQSSGFPQGKCTPQPKWDPDSGTGSGQGVTQRLGADLCAEPEAWMESHRWEFGGHWWWGTLSDTRRGFSWWVLPNSLSEGSWGQEGPTACSPPSTQTPSLPGDPHPASDHRHRGTLPHLSRPLSRPQMQAGSLP